MLASPQVERNPKKPVDNAIRVGHLLLRPKTNDKRILASKIMALKCSNCGYSTQNDEAKRCVLCKASFADQLLEDAEKLTTAFPQSPTPSAQSNQGRAPVDNRNWIVKSIHGRSVGGIVISVLMILAGLFGGSFKKANATLFSSELVGVGFVILLFSLLLFFATKRR